MSNPLDKIKILSGARATIKINGNVIGHLVPPTLITDPPWSTAGIIEYKATMSAEQVERSFRFLGIVRNPIRYWLRRKEQW